MQTRNYSLLGTGIKFNINENSFFISFKLGQTKMDISLKYEGN